MGPPRANGNNSAIISFQSSNSTLEVLPITAHNLTSRISKLEKLFADEVAPYTLITDGIHSQYLLLYDTFRQLKAGITDAIIWKVPSVEFVLDSAKAARPSSDPLIEPATSFSSPIFRTHPHGYNFLVKWQVYINPIHLLHWWLRQFAPMALLEDHLHWYPWSTGPTEHMHESNSARPIPGLQETHNLNKNRSCDNHHQ